MQLDVLKVEVDTLKSEASRSSASIVGMQSASRANLGPASRHTGSRAAPASHRKDSEAAKCEIILLQFGGHLAHSTVVKAYKAWAEVHLTEGTPLPSVKTKRIDGSAKLVFESAVVASNLLDTLNITLESDAGLAVGKEKLKLRISTPFRPHGWSHVQVLEVARRSCFFSILDSLPTSFNGRPFLTKGVRPMAESFSTYLTKVLK